ncbi:C-type lectin domain family 7 member A-like [Hemitrygon akajei]|uniref:C-type lectin domain family 7 member A-like n=1 Tax=Hemitrygon akajei TaxID=2704970 RepID=UPI003BF98D93
MDSQANLRDGMGSERPARRDRPDSSIWLICVLTATLIITGICWRIHVLQIRQSQIRAEPTYTLRWREYQDICGFITSIRDQACSQDWIKNEDRSYFLSTLATYYDKAKKHCSNLHAKLLEINSKQEENVVSNFPLRKHRTYWVGKCKDGEVTSSLMFRKANGTPFCDNCDSSTWRNHCNRQHHFICEKSANLSTDILQKIQDLCQQPVGPN